MSVTADLTLRWTAPTTDDIFQVTDWEGTVCKVDTLKVFNSNTVWAKGFIQLKNGTYGRRRREVCITTDELPKKVLIQLLAHFI